MTDQVVVVTGGCGFLGQHVVKHLQLYAPWITEIRVLDMIPYRQKLKGFRATIPVQSYVGDITDDVRVREVLHGACAVIHLASAIDSGFQPNVELLYRVNVQGTSTVLDACKREGVESLIYCSSIGPYMGWEDVTNGNETMLKHRPDPLFKDYGRTKAEAEKMVLEANGSQLKNGRVLRTLSVVPSTMYGELDFNIVGKCVQAAKAAGGVVPPLGNGKTREQYCYGGNVAYGIVCALNTLREDESVGGENFFLNDDTPLRPGSHLMEPLLQQCGYRLSRFYIPSWLMFIVIAIVQVLCLLVSPFKRISFTLSLSAVKFTMTNFNVTYDKAASMLNYKPLYSFKEAMRVTTEWAKEYFSKT